MRLLYVSGFFGCGLGLFVGALMSSNLTSFIAGGIFMLLALILVSTEKIGGEDD